jgi:acetyl-CoA carboxylase carboxyltransferase component
VPDLDAPVVEVESPFTGVVIELLAASGDPVAAGSAVLIVESMKMHHEVTAPATGLLRDLRVASGDQVHDGDVLFAVDVRDGGVARVAADAEESDGGAIRPDLQRVLDRRDGTRDAARPAAVERRHRAGRRTARDNVDDLCDAGTFSEYGALALAAQRARRSEQELIDQTPGDGMVCGIAAINGADFGAEAARCAVISYDYTVLAGTQGVRNHKKTDRVLDVAERLALPVVLFAEGGGGRPGDTDQSELFHLVVPTFRSFARLSGLVPRIGIASGRCFAGNAALLGCCDVVIATPDASIGMGGPAMIEGGGLGRYAPEEVGPADVQVANGVIDVLAADEAAAVDAARRIVAYFQGDLGEWERADQRLLRAVVPEDPKRIHDARAAIDLLTDSGSAFELRRGYGAGIVTTLARIEGRAVGLIANDPAHLSGAIDADDSDKAARFMQLCDAFGLPIVTLVDTPGFMVGPDSEATATVRRCSRMFVTAATLSVPWLCVVVRRAYGLGAQAMAGGDFHAPLLNVAWPTGEFGAMGVEGAVRLALRRELEAIEDEGEREQRVRDLVAQVRANSGALNMAAHFEIDDVIDPAETRGRIVEALKAVGPIRSSGRRRTMVDTW